MTKDNTNYLENKNRVTHGLYSFRDRGPDALTEEKRSRYAELKEQFDSEPGRIEYRKELATHLATMLELGFSDIRARAERGQPIWSSPPVARMGTYVNALIRLQDNWPKEAKDNRNILELMKGNQDDEENSDQGQKE
jgi:hypothetical protein